MNLDSLETLLSSHRYRFSSERDLQNGIDEVLQTSGLSYRREFSLGVSDRPDFLVHGGIAIEVKIKGSISELIRQISRYATHNDVSAILVVGTPHWIPRVPEIINEKPVRPFRLLGSLL